MKKLTLILGVSVLCFALAPVSRAAIVTGFVRCDANQNQTNDIFDVGIPNVLVVITNQNHSFSGSGVTAADGSFAIHIPDFSALAERQDPLSQVYVETLDPATLPAGSSIIFPQPITYISLTPAFYIDFAADLTNVVFTSATENGAPEGNFLINSPNCQSATCSLTGHGTISGDSKHPEHSFGGTVSTSAPRHGTNFGRWTHLAVAEKLQFRSTTVQMVNSGTVSGAPSGPASSINMIEFSGVGTLRGIHGNKAKYDLVDFIVRAEDHGQPGGGNDRYYIRVYLADGTTLLLVSGDSSNPENIVTVPISKGNFRIRSLKRR